MLITRLRITGGNARFSSSRCCRCTPPRPKFFQAATQADFLKGDVENLSIDSNGQLTLGPTTELVYETSAPFLWSMVPAADGALFVGTGNEGKVFRIDAQGKGSLFFDSTELEAHALAPAPNGGLYVGTSPDGTHLQGRSQRQLVDVLRRRRQVHLGAGRRRARATCSPAPATRASIYKIAPDGKGTTFYKTNATHATALAFDKAGNLLVGTGTPGKVLRIDAEGKAFVLLDSPFQEIRALRFDDKGALYVAAISGRPAPAAAAPISRPTALDRPTPDPSRAPVPSVSAEITSISIVDVGGGSGSTRHDARGSPRAEGRRLPHRAGRRLGSAVGIARRLAVRPDLRSERRADRRHRQQGQDLSARRRSAAADAARARQRAAGDRVLQGLRAAGCTTRPPTRASCSGSRRSARRAAPTSPKPRDAQMVSTWGAISWRGDDAGRQPHRAVHAIAATPKRPTTPGAPGRRPTRTPTARRSPARRRATCSGAPS